MPSIKLSYVLCMEIAKALSSYVKECKGNELIQNLAYLLLLNTTMPFTFYNGGFVMRSNNDSGK